MWSPKLHQKMAVYGGGFFFLIHGMATMYFSLYAQQIGASTLAIGLMVTLRGLLPIFIAMPAGQLIDSIGPMRMLKLGAVCLLISVVTTVFATGNILLSVSQLFMGAAILIMNSSLQVLVSSGDKRERDENIKKFSMWNSAGLMVGPLLGGAIVSVMPTELSGYRMSFIFLTVVSSLVLAVIVYASRHYAHPDPEQAELKPRDLLKARGILDSYTSGMYLMRIRAVQFGLAGTFLIQFVQAIYLSFLPLYLKELGYAAMMISLVIALQGLASMVSRLALGWIMERTNLERILSLAGLIAAICVILTPLAGIHLTTIVLLILILGAAVGINLPVSIMIMVNVTQENERGKLMGLRLLTNRFSQITSPAMFGVLGQAVGLTAGFYVSGILLVGAMLGFTTFSALKADPGILDGPGKEEAPAVRSGDRTPMQESKS